MNYYFKETDEVLKEVDSTPAGLTSQQVAERVAKYGKNKLDEPPKKTLLQRFFSSLADPMIIMLLAAAGISTATTVYQNVALGANESYADLFIILTVVTINTILGVVQESKAEEAIAALKEMTAATSKVLRDGQQAVIKSEDITIGDIIILEAGDAVPADCRILESHSLKLEEAALTGESVPVNKMVDALMMRDGKSEIPLGDRDNMVYSGSTVVYGRGSAVVVAIGMDTEMGKIATALNEAEDETTPLQRKMAELSRVLTKLVIGICAFVFVFGVARELLFSSDSGADIFSVVLDTFIISVALAVAAIPEGLPAVVTIILSIGVTAMSKRNALIRKLTAVETLGCTQIICSDKTGTLTMNRMTVVDSFGSADSLLAGGMALCSDAKIGENDLSAVGEPTEAALVNYAAHKYKMPSTMLDAEHPRMGEAPFDSMRKMMSVVVKDGYHFRQYTKGANEIVINLCTHYLDENSEIKPMTEKYRTTVNAKAKEFADRALRVLGLGYRDYDRLPESFDAEDLEHDMIYVGFVGMIDPCRKEVYGAIRECAEAGIRPVMITGDHIDTAAAIGKDLHIISDSSEAMIGADLDALSDEELVETVKKVSVFARVQPEHKTRIVRAFKSMGYICAMTGDGVNDAPSIKAADIGVGMGITGTDVTKGVADMVLADDNFATIVNAVEEGRKIYDNVRKVIQFQLSTNMSEVLTIFVSSLLGVNILSAAHLLWINMVTDSAPGLALGMEKAESDLMRRKPRSSSESVFAHGAGVDMILQGIYMAALVVSSFFIGVYLETGHINMQEIMANGSADGMTMAFLTCNFVEMFHAISMRTQRGNIFKLKSFNWWLLGAFVLTVMLTCTVIYVPVLKDLFGCTAISLKEFAVAFGLAFSVIPVLEIFKAIFRAIDRRKQQA
ncbi:MAG: calcium-translocating P-type ATPase, PMCA-type [Erysipelotrichaceae bacterium]|nr:calcium-translocating P-type ATPase, PMCA-type [Erysipelotrichaceae bacterium]